MIGVLDWGIGGIGVYKSLREKKIDTDICYFSDSGNIPYGKLTKEELRERFLKLSPFFKKNQCEFVLVACNAASSAINGEFEEFAGLRFYSIIPNATFMVLNSPYKKIAVIGGNQTISSGIYQKAFINSKKQFFFQSAQPLSALVEKGIVEGPEVEKIVSDIVLNFPKFDALFLACTHYPALNHIFRKIKKDIILLDPADTMAQLNFPSGQENFNFTTTGNLKSSLNSIYVSFGVNISEYPMAPIGINYL